MIPVVSILGTSGSEKTTLLEKIIPELKLRGYRVALGKHETHGFDIDHEKKIPGDSSTPELKLSLSPPPIRSH